MKGGLRNFAKFTGKHLLLLTGTLNTLDYTTCRFLRGNQYYLQISYVIDYRRNFLTKQSESILYDTNVCFKRIKRWKKV